MSFLDIWTEFLKPSLYPVAIVIGAFVLRKQLAPLIKRLSKVAKGDFSAEFHVEKKPNKTFATDHIPSNNTEKNEPLETKSSLVGFWDTVRPRHEIKCDARNLIASSNQRIFLSGITLNYIIQHCTQEIEAAIRQRIPVEIVIAANTDDAIIFYKRYSSLIEENLPVAHNRYQQYRDNLPPDLSKFFNVYSTQIPFTHSIGLYDDRLFVSELCIDTNSSGAPSYELLKDSEAYKTYIEEIKKLLAEGIALYESDPSRIVDIL